MRLGDLFLDTPYFNAHTTASDSLWAGVPVLTWSGETFSSRVAASLVTAVGMPELIVSSLEEYERLGAADARELELLTELKAKLARQRTTMPLFDTPRLCRNIERAYREMWRFTRRASRCGCC